MKDEIEKVYRNSSAEVRASFGDNALAAGGYYQDLIEFVTGTLAPSSQAKLLDVGCGSGWSTYMFSEAGYDATGIDLNPDRFEVKQGPGCHLTFGSGTDIPFESETFDLVSCYQCLEHIPEPEKALREMIRVCRPGGVISIVGPNLVSPITGLLFLADPKSWRVLKWMRTTGTARHPYGDTYAEIFGYSVLRTIQLTWKLLNNNPGFILREPDLVPPFEADNDACYLLNPTDVVKFFRKNKLKVIRNGKPGRPPLTHLIAGGTWVAAKKSTPSNLD